MRVRATAALLGLATLVVAIALHAAGNAVGEEVAGNVGFFLLLAATLLPRRLWPRRRRRRRLRLHEQPLPRR